MQEVTLHLTIRQSSGGQTTVTDNRYEGKAVEKAAGWYFSYQEDLEGIGEVGAVIRVAESDVTLLRQGSLQMKQVFSKNRSTESAYVTPHGRFWLKTHTRKLRIERTGDRPTGISLAYQLWLQDEYLGESVLTLGIEWKE
ncbi:DUF1934 domain-containing protein [Brevibacillus sp. B_LB10_24]|uniref:DUF1934 domain-containing protein n=1 Tax=Brevibacillus sp. B_LB10_24 TaxID=3380645 RepID=UPI0038BC90B2